LVDLSGVAASKAGAAMKRMSDTQDSPKAPMLLAFVALFHVIGQRSRRAAPAAGTQNRCKDKTADGALTVVKAGKN
jgi:hypothetical protein